MIVVDASALVAIADDEPERARFLQVLTEASDLAISSINAVETGLILIGRRRLKDVDELNLWLADLHIEVIHDRPSHSEALAAYLTFGRTYHPARLNLADCFAYALAKSMDAPLLFKGGDFPQTDIRPAVQPT